MQQKNESNSMANQLTDSAVQPLFAKWVEQLRARVPADKQKDVGDQLNVELKKFGDSTHQLVQAQATKTAQDALVPVFMDKLSEDELKTIVTYWQTPASAKFAAMSNDAANAWGQKIIEGTQATVEGYIKTFDDAAEKIVNAAAANALIAPAGSASAPASAPVSTPASAPASSASN
jgi:hypothetical protein